MKRFAELFTSLDQTTATNEKIRSLVQFFSGSNEESCLWAIALFSGKKPKRTIKTSELKQWAIEMTGLPEWLFEESYQVVGDLAETITLILPPPTKKKEYTLDFVIKTISGLGNTEADEKKALVQTFWNNMNTTERFVFNKLITGSFRIGVSQQIMIKALSKFSGIDEKSIAHRLMGEWKPDHYSLQKLLYEENILDDLSKPYPFYLAYPMDIPPEELGEIEEWQIERKFDGIRGQIIVRNNNLFVWSRGEELLTEKFPEFEVLKEQLPDGTVLDGEILPFANGNPLPFHRMQTRIGRKNLTKKALEEAPLILMAYDLLEYEGKDIRHLPLKQRRILLEKIISTTSGVLKLSPSLTVQTWEEVVQERASSEHYFCEGLMLKKRDSPYESGRRRGKWWKWKVDARTIDGVLIYAQAGHGRRADLYTDYTFAVWDGDQLVPFTKAYSGLTDKELIEVDAYIKKNTIEKFGPVRSVTPGLVFEIAFEGINPSPRHKSGVALRFPRINRWRRDKGIKEANTKEDLLKLIDLR
jgi:DNA ligase-1